jgi:hypothetical protein
MNDKLRALARRGRKAATDRECIECEQSMRLERQEGRSRWYCCLGCELLWELVEEADKVSSWVRKPLPMLSKRLQ